MAKNPFLLVGSEASKSVVFIGGTSNILSGEVGSDGKAALIRNTARDGLHDALAAMEVPFYDPQIHPDTHGRSYDYPVDGPAEQAARAASKVTVYELGSGAQGFVTAMEILQDAAAGKNVIVWLNCVNSAGKLEFAPNVDLSTVTDPVALAHLNEYKKNGTSGRNSVQGLLQKYPHVIVARSEAEALSAIQTQLKS